MLLLVNFGSVSTVSHDFTWPISIPCIKFLIFELLFILVQLFYESFIWADMFSPFLYLLKRRFNANSSLFHQIWRCYSGASGDTRLAMHQDICTRDVLSNELVSTIKKALYILSWVIRDQDSKMLDIGVYEETFLSEYWNDGANQMFIEFLLVFCNFNISQC